MNPRRPLAVARLKQCGRGLLPAFALLIFFIPAGVANVAGQVVPKAPPPVKKTPDKKVDHPRHYHRPLSVPVSDSSEKFLDLGDKFFDKGKWNAAEVAYKESARLSPNNSNAWAAMGTLYNTAARFGDALRAFNRANDGSNPEVVYGLAYAHLRIGNRQAAMGGYQVLKSLDPDKAAELLHEMEKQQ